jgi:autotransporter-associated beta strand protein/T5SS/PEP-CTERM-associated repeat protein
LGYNAGSSNNSGLVTGPGSSWNISGASITAGLGGSGNSLVVSNGGHVTTEYTYISRGAGAADNSVVVTGPGSTLSNSWNMLVGVSGSGGSLVVSDGATIRSWIGQLGYNAGSSNNSALVIGSGSVWNNPNSYYGITVGMSGGATLTVANGGTVNLNSTGITLGLTLAEYAGSSGTLNIGRFGTNDAAGTVSTPKIAFGAGTGTINFHQTNSTTISAPISGNGSVNQLGSGTTTLTGNNTYTGPTTVAAGDLVVNGSIANSTVTVNNGGTLSGSGSVGGIVLNLGSTINPGNSPGTHSVAGNVVWNAGANYNWQIHDTALGAGSGWDLIDATGTLDLSALTVGSQFNINLWSLQSLAPDANGPAFNFDPNQSYTWTILSAAGGISGFTGSSQFDINIGAINGTGGFANALNGGSFSIAQSLNGKNLNLVFTAAGGPGAPSPVPEPGTWAAAALLAGGAAFLRWRKRNKAS